ncbi:DUF4910 domain-containing protein [Gracilibacillus sp. YIM 98692]|uniref:DUF4910 domain-containing protein n=1 Tax=Gracilibacillus sp. YIM 98692 TaxID=2663532 RepID=UPI0013D824F5|nr:DUF4910 domain-containing protein [Gracilibacillus sp. YIM 98692]
MASEGLKMYELMEKLFPICRSITGEGVRETLRDIQEHIPLEVKEVPSGTEVFDWTIPREWNINDAYVKNDQGEKIIDFQQNNLHVMGYSVPVDKRVTREELEEHLYSLPDQPNAIPYVTSYYKERWGFCIRHGDRTKLTDREYYVKIDSSLENGSLTYGELIIPGEQREEVFLSTYICHPSMANNELSGPVLLSHLVKWLRTKKRKYTYRIVFVPETIGALTYLSRNLEEMKENIIAGFNITCVGDDLEYSFLPSRYGNTLSDRVALKIMEDSDISFKKYSFLERGSDERQYCSPGIDLPIASIMRTKYWEYPEYHTSLDNLDFVSPNGLQGAFDIYKACIELIEQNEKFMVNCLGEPQLGKRGLYPTISKKGSANRVRDILNVLTYADGTNDLIDISYITGLPVSDVLDIVYDLYNKNLLIVKEREDIASFDFQLN